MSRVQIKLNINDLQKLLNRSRSQLNKLVRKRSRLQNQIDELDRQITRLGGISSFGNIRTRARNTMSLADAIAKTLETESKPMPVSDIVQSVRAAGYRSNSPNFRAIVNQALIKDDRFITKVRGVYQLKK